MVWASAGWSDETRAYMATCVVFMMSASFLHVASVVHTSLVWTQRPRRWCDAGWGPLVPRPEPPPRGCPNPGQTGSQNPGVGRVLLPPRTPPPRVVDLLS